jgi:mannose/cellobiose epimerase-like protein (N-acyl-D-glucosamine 2-epimerase family)
LGFYNAYQLSGEAHFLEASQRAWDYIKERVVDKVHGEWYAKLSPQGVPYTEKEDPADACLAGVEPAVRYARRRRLTTTPSSAKAQAASSALAG